MSSQWLDEAVAAAVPTMVADRRHLHQHPELSGAEFETARFIADRLRSLGLSPQLLLDDTAVIADLDGRLGSGGAPARNLLLRADIDALPIQENNPDRPYRSKVSGVMHACGHDAHVAIALTVAEILTANRERFAGRVRFAFQPAEERVNGAARMIAAGAMGEPPASAVIGLHVLRQLPVGTVGVRDGALFGSADEFAILIQGRSAHGGLPHQGLDPIPVAAAVVLQLQTLVSREISPLDSAVLSVGTIHGGEVINNLADSVAMTGSLRAFRPELRDQLVARTRAVVAGIAEAAGMSATVTFGASSPPVISDPRMVELVRLAARLTPGASVLEVGPLSVGDDMAEFLQAAPGCYFLLGAGPPAGAETPIAPHHHPDFDLDERCLPLGARGRARAALDFCARGFTAGPAAGPAAAARRVDGG